MKKVLIVLVAAVMLFSVAKANAQQMGVYGEYLGSAAAGFGGGVQFGMVKVGAHYFQYFFVSGISIGGGVNVPVAKIMDNKIDLGIDAQLHYVLGLLVPAWSIPAGVTFEYKVDNKMSIYGGGGVDINNIDGLLTLSPIGARFLVQAGVKYAL